MTRCETCQQLLAPAGVEAWAILDEAGQPIPALTFGTPRAAKQYAKAAPSARRYAKVRIVVVTE